VVIPYVPPAEAAKEDESGYTALSGGLPLIEPYSDGGGDREGRPEEPEPEAEEPEAEAEEEYTFTLATAVAKGPEAEKTEAMAEGGAASPGALAQRGLAPAQENEEAPAAEGEGGAGQPAAPGALPHGPEGGAAPEAPAESAESPPPLTKDQIRQAALAGESVLKFLGAAETPDEYGYFLLWDAAEPDALPAQRK
jgi:hypothetical protein